MGTDTSAGPPAKTPPRVPRLVFEAHWPIAGSYLYTTSRVELSDEFVFSLMAGVSISKMMEAEIRHLLKGVQERAEKEART